MNLFEQLQWLKDHPEFKEIPATIREFCGSDYLNVEKGMRVAVLDELEQMFGARVSGDRMALVKWGIFTGAIGIGKTTVASIVLPYMAHWCLCLKDPQDYFALLPGSRIAFMMMSTSEKQAREVLFADIQARIRYSPWFKTYAIDKNFRNQIRFMEKDIWIIPGDSTETSFEGYNILGGIIDEADSHKVTEEKDYADVGFDTIDGRISSRFGERGFLLIIGQMKKAMGFASRKYDEFKENPSAYAAKLTIWESFGWEKYLRLDGTRDSFWYDVKRKAIVPSLIAMDLPDSTGLIEIPNTYKDQFINNPEKSLRDLAGIPPAVGDPFISLVDRIEECRDKWVERMGIDSPFNDSPLRPLPMRGWRAKDKLKRALHIDLAYSGNGDACGIAIGHVREMVDLDGELKPYIIFDALARIHASAGQEIELSQVRNFVYDLRDEYGFNIKMITMDGFESTDTMQQFRKKRFMVDYLSVDKQLLPYYDLREAIYEKRLEFPKYITYKRAGDAKTYEPVVKELMELQETHNKIDHPEGGSKDVSDAMAGVVYTLMGDRSFRRGRVSMSSSIDTTPGSQDGDEDRYGGISHPGMGMMGDAARAPLPPSQLDLLGPLKARQTSRR